MALGQRIRHSADGLPAVFGSKRPKELLYWLCASDHSARRNHLVERRQRVSRRATALTNYPRY